MAIADRVRNICVDPRREWPVIEREQTSPADLVTGYLAPLAALGALAGFVGGSIVGAFVPFVGTVRQTIAAGIVGACVAFVMTIAACFVLGWIINALAPTFGGQKDSAQAFKVAVYAYTPSLLAALLSILPVFGALVSVVAGLYGLYLLYLALPVLMKAPVDKSIAYTAAVVATVIVVTISLGIIFGIFGATRLITG